MLAATETAPVESFALKLFKNIELLIIHEVKRIMLARTVSVSDTEGHCQQPGDENVKVNILLLS
jgi:hypothetical protein